jgi:hypothetical protein
MALDPANPTNFFYLDGYDRSTSPFGLIHYANTTATKVDFAYLGVNGAAGKGTGYVKTTQLWPFSSTGTSAGINAITANERFVCISSGGVLLGNYATYGGTVWNNASNYTTSLTTGAHGVYCYDRLDASGNMYRKIGSNPNTTIRGGSSLGLEDELASGSMVQVNHPHGLAFDADGNLYVAERGSHVVKMIKRWW